MDRWEYTQLRWSETVNQWQSPSVVVNPADDELEIANRLGDDGWELAWIDQKRDLWFKRRRPAKGSLADVRRTEDG